MIGIRADANKIIATGHVMRCITIAKELLALGEGVTFFVADKESEAFIKSFCDESLKAEVVVLGTRYDHMEDEIPVLEKELPGRKCDVLFVDSYFVSKDYFARLNRICPVAYLDDLAKEPYPVDLVINYNGFSKSLGYEALYSGMKGHEGSPTKILLGLEYAPLRRQFYEHDIAEKTTSDKKTLKVLLAAGGGDMYGMLLATLENAEKKGLLSSSDGRGDLDASCRPIEWEVVAGSFAPDIDKIKALEKNYSGVHIHHNVANMAALMRSCDIAVSAAGTMLTECAAVNLPAIFYQVADNQKPNTDFWPTTGGMVYAGNAAESAEAKGTVISRICDEIHDLSLAPEKLLNMRDSLMGITDGRGAIGIAKALISLK